MFELTLQAGDSGDGGRQSGDRPDFYDFIRKKYDFKEEKNISLTKSLSNSGRRVLWLYFY